MKDNNLEKWCIENNKEYLLSEWHYEKNLKELQLMPNNIAPGSSRKVYWKCDKGHSWETTIAHRVSDNTGCPGCAVCSKKRFYKGENDLFTYCNNHLEVEHLLTEWNYKRNQIKPDEVVAHSDKKVWWICQNKHEWCATIESRVRGNNCSKCNSQTSFPEQAIYYYVSKKFKNSINRYNFNKIELDIFIPELNIGIEYDGLFFHKNSEIKEKLKNEICNNNNIRLIRIREEGLCLYQNCECIVKKNNDSDNSLNNAIKTLLISLHIDYDVDVKRDRKNILKQYRLYQDNKTIKSEYPNLVLDWDIQENNGLKLSNFSKGSHCKAHWKCSQCGYKWIAEIKSRVNGHGCKICGRNKTIKSKSHTILNIDTNIIYESLTDAQRKTGIDCHSISKCCKGKIQKAGGFHWKYYVEERQREELK